MMKKTYSLNVPTIIVSAIVAVAVSAPLSNAANDQIKVVVKKVAGKQGKRGPRGERGPQGPQGPQGPAGRDATEPSGFGYVLVRQGATRTLYAQCATFPASDPTGGSVEVATWPGQGGTPVVVREGVGLIGKTKPAYYAVVRNDGDDIFFVQAIADCS